MLTLQLRITGMVQGVGYRYAFHREAVRLGIGGWVRNRSDGSVEAVVQGAQQAVDAIAAWTQRGPPAARVNDVTTATPGAAEQARRYEGFEIRATL
jgi:acylphosphatase